VTDRTCAGSPQALGVGRPDTPRTCRVPTPPVTEHPSFIISGCCVKAQFDPSQVGADDDDVARKTVGQLGRPVPAATAKRTTTQIRRTRRFRATPTVSPMTSAGVHPWRPPRTPQFMGTDLARDRYRCSRATSDSHDDERQRRATGSREPLRSVSSAGCSSTTAAVTPGRHPRHRRDEKCSQMADADVRSTAGDPSTRRLCSGGVARCRREIAPQVSKLRASSCAVRAGGPTSVNHSGAASSPHAGSHRCRGTPGRRDGLRLEAVWPRLNRPWPPCGPAGRGGGIAAPGASVIHTTAREPCETTRRHDVRP
jgi:hypothetical protein